MNLTIEGERFFLDGKVSYERTPDERLHGLLMNARFIQGVFDDQAGRERYHRFSRGPFDPERNTDRLIDALPEWRDHGLQAFTVGFQGGGPCFTVDNDKIDNNPFGSDGGSLDDAYAARMDRLIRAADAAGMAVIVSLLYGAQSRHLVDGAAVRRAVATGARFLRNGGYHNVIIEVANEHNNAAFECHPIVRSAEGCASLMDLARRESDGMPVGCSGNGGDAFPEVCRESDVVLIHGNGCSRGRLARLIRQVRAWAPGRPVVCNEDSQALGNLGVCLEQGVSWGYYNNLTKQEPPADWGITDGEDRYFATRLSRALGIDVPEIPKDRQIYLAGFEPGMTDNGERWIRLASLEPEQIDRVRFFRNGALFEVAYDEPFAVGALSTWRQRGTRGVEQDRSWRAEVLWADGGVSEREWRP